mgnify:CR=1 FL=1
MGLLPRTLGRRHLGVQLQGNSMRQSPIFCVIIGVLLISGCATTPEGALPTELVVATDEPVPEVVEVEVVEVEEEAPASLSYYTGPQASRGERFFRETCLSCHESSEFRGRSFQRGWRGRSVADLFDEIVYTMPDDNPGGLPTQTYIDVIAYILRINRFPSGDVELSADMDLMQELPLFPRTP